MQSIPGVDSVSKTMDPESLAPKDEILAPSARLRRNSLGGLQAVILEPDELPSASIDAREITFRKGNAILR